MEFIETNFNGLYCIRNNKIEDERGFFARTFCKREFEKISFFKDFVQFNHSDNAKKGTLRGMHYQSMPHVETKLIRCLKGSVLDVAVDIRKDSPTFLKYFAIELNEENMISILIPEGFAHGFQTLDNNSILIYHHTEYYNQHVEAGIRYNDPSIGINWPLPIVNLSNKDKNYPLIDNNFQGIKL